MLAVIEQNPEIKWESLLSNLTIAQETPSDFSMEASPSSSKTDEDDLASFSL